MNILWLLHLTNYQEPLSREKYSRNLDIWQSLGVEKSFWHFLMEFFHYDTSISLMDLWDNWLGGNSESNTITYLCLLKLKAKKVFLLSTTQESLFI